MLLYALYNLRVVIKIYIASFDLQNNTTLMGNNVATRKRKYDGNTSCYQTLTAKEEANLACYIALYDLCDKKRCWEQIGNIIQKYGVKMCRTVYRGHSSQDKTITAISPFFSTTPNKHMAELFVGKDWALPLKSQRVGYLFTIHLVDCLALSTRHVKYTLTPDVKEELRKIVGNRTIEKGGGNFTFEQFFPRIKRLLHDLVFDERDHNGEEILVSSRGTFYKSSALNIKGFRNKTPHDLVTWYKTDDFTQPSKRKRL